MYNLEAARYQEVKHGLCISAKHYNEGPRSGKDLLGTTKIILALLPPIILLGKELK